MKTGTQTEEQSSAQSRNHDQFERMSVAQPDFGDDPLLAVSVPMSHWGINE